MAEPRRATLLQLAIGASLVVLPALLALLLAAGWLRDARAPADGAEAERYENVRLVAALRSFERGIVARERAAQGPPDADALLAGLPACRNAWATSEGALAAFARRIGLRDGAAPPTPAQRHAARLVEIDRALTRFSTRQNGRCRPRCGWTAHAGWRRPTRRSPPRCARAASRTGSSACAARIWPARSPRWPATADACWSRSPGEAPSPPPASPTGAPIK
jgi:hypothetical protein